MPFSRSGVYIKMTYKSYLRCLIASFSKVLVLTGTFGFASVAHASGILDAYYLEDQGTTNFGFSGEAGSQNPYFRRAQTFTVGRAGELTEVDIRIIGNPKFTGLNILSTINGAPTQTVIATGSLVATDSFFARFFLSAPVTVGETLAIEPLGAQSGGWVGLAPGTYQGGGDFVINPQIFYDEFTATGFDAEFRTFVTVAPTVPTVPLPHSGPLFGASLLSLGIAGYGMKRKKTRHPA